MNLCSELARKK